MRYVDINTIMDDITKHPMLNDLSIESAISYAIEFMQVVGIPTTFMDKTAIINISEYRGQLPCDFYEMIQVRLAPNSEKPPELSPTFRYSTDSFHMSPSKPKVSDLTYKLQGGCIFTSPLEEGPIEIAYKAMPVNDDGIPLIPDDAVYLRALRAYIKKEWFGIQFDQGKIDPRVIQRAEQEYAFYVGQAQARAILPTIDQMENIKNMWNTMIVRGQDHRKGFLHEGSKEHLRNH